MKLLNSKLIQKREGRKKPKYVITLEVTDYDIEMLEDLAWVYTCGCGRLGLEEHNKQNPRCDGMTKKYSTWCKKTFHEFWKLWRDYDE